MTTEGQHLENCGVVTRSKTKIKKRLTYIYLRKPGGGGGHWPFSVVLMISGPGRLDFSRIMGC